MFQMFSFKRLNISLGSRTAQGFRNDLRIEVIIVSESVIPLPPYINPLLVVSVEDLLLALSGES